MKAGPKAEKTRGQKLVQTIFMLLFPVEFALPALDHRFGWSRVPAIDVIIGDLMMLAGLAVSFSVARVNTYTSAIIEVVGDQKVVSTGPYATIRHPLYSGALMMLYATPLALGSWWGLLLNIPMTVALIWRLLDEERFLVKNLKGYAEYRQHVKFRLVPLVW